MSDSEFSPLLRDFIDRTGFQPPADPLFANRMQTAIEFFHECLPEWIDFPLDLTDKGYEKFGYSAFALKIDGKVTKFTAAMQAIDFHFDVKQVVLFAGTTLRRYCPQGKPGLGAWYADIGTPASMLALPPDQFVPYDVKLSANGRALSSTAGDLLVDWNMDATRTYDPQRNIHYHYRHGGGIQYLIPNADKILRSLA